MLRERAFALGGGLLVGLGGVLIVVALVADGGPAGVPSGYAGAVSVVLGVFFLAVAREAKRYRQEYLRAAEEGRELPPGGAPP